MVELGQQLDDLHLPGRKRGRDDRPDQGQPGARDRHDHARRRRAGHDLPGQRHDPVGGHGMSRLRAPAARRGRADADARPRHHDAHVDARDGARRRRRRRQHPLGAVGQAADRLSGGRGRHRRLHLEARRGQPLLHPLRPRGRVDAQGDERHARRCGRRVALRPQLDVPRPAQRVALAPERLPVQPRDHAAERRDEQRDHDPVDREAGERRQHVRLGEPAGAGAAGLAGRLHDVLGRRGLLRLDRGHERPDLLEQHRDHSGTASASIFAYGGFSGSVTLQNGAKVYSGAAAVQAVLPNAPINFNSFLGALVNVQNASQSGGVYLNDATVAAWQIVFQPDGTFTAQTCQQSERTGRRRGRARLRRRHDATTSRRTARSTRRRPSSSPARSTDASPSPRTTTSTSAATRAT